MRRVISVWLPRWPIDRLRRERARSRAGPAHWAAAETAEAAEAAKAAAPSAPVPFALVAPGRRGPVLWAVNREAGAQGLRPGMRLADARALHAGLVTARADPAADRQGLERLALWCNRFTPWCAVDGGGDGDGSGNGDDGGLLLDITGCAHLFGGEAALMDEIAARVTGLGVESRLGLADTSGAAWALARFGPAETRSSGRTHRHARRARTRRSRASRSRALQARGRGCPPAAPPRALTTIGAVEGLPRASLARRFPCRERGSAVLARLDRALGRQAEPIVPMAPPPACLERLALPEPLIDRAGLDAALARLMPGLAASLERDGLGVRRLVPLVLPGRRRRGPARGRHGARDAGRRSLAASLPGDAGDRRPRLRHRSRGAPRRARRAAGAQAAFARRG